MSSGRFAIRVTVVSVVASMAVVGLASAAGAAGTSATTPTVSPRSSTGQGTLTRIAGADRVSTSVAISQAGFPTNQSAQAVVLATGAGFADSLAGGPLAAHFQGPLLLLPPAGLIDVVRAEIQRVLPSGRTVYVLGGPSAIAASVDAQIQAAGFTPVRLAGADRFATAVKVAQALGDPPTVFEVDGTNYPDALSAGPAAALSHGAVLLTSGSTASAATVAYLALHPADSRYAIGGPAATSDPTAKPLVGADRYATSVLVAEQLFAAPSAVSLAGGEEFPDALAGGPVAGLNGAPIILVPPTGPLPSTVQAYLNRASNSVLSAMLFGGTVAVSTPVARAIAQALVLVPSAT
jgi:putative cell wall-binding protein